MGPVRVVMIDVVDDKPLKLATVPDDGPVEEFASQGADPAFGERVRHGSTHRCGEDLAAFGSEDLVEGVDELAGAVSHECPGVGELVAVTEQQVPGGLGGPDAAGVVRDPCEVHAPSRDVDEEQQVEPAQRDRVDGGEIAGDGGLGPQELRPSDFAASGCGSIPAFFRICQTVDAARRWPSPASSPWMRRYPQVGFSAARRSASRRSSAGVDGRPGGRCG